LVRLTEQALATELSGWTQRMTDALDNLRKDQEKEAQDALDNLRKDQEKEANDKGTESAGRSEGGPSLVVAVRSDATPTAPSSQLSGAR
jgi:hypothetical protein